MSPRVILSVTNDLTIDNRLHKVCTTLNDHGYEVLLVGRKRPSSQSLAPRAYKTYRIPMLFNRGKLFYLEYNVKLFFFLLFSRVDIFTANDHDVLLPNFLVARLRRKKLVFDLHEYFTELPELVRRPRTRTLWVKLEQTLLPRLKEFSTINETIADIYREKYGKTVHVIPNVPRQRHDIDRNQIPKNNIILYQGNIHPARGIELMIEAMQHIKGARFVLAGGGDIVDDISKLVKKFGVEDRVEFLGEIPLEKLPDITAQAKLGISLEEPFGLNSTYSLPNKFLDYIQAGVPVIVSDIPELKKITLTYDVGIVIPDRNPIALANHINILLKDHNRYLKYRHNTILASQKLCWENYEKTLLKMYE